MKYFNLDVIISVGYRVKSIRGTQFRQWANSEGISAKRLFSKPPSDRAGAHRCGTLQEDRLLRVHLAATARRYLLRRSAIRCLQIRHRPDTDGKEIHPADRQLRGRIRIADAQQAERRSESRHLYADDKQPASTGLEPAQQPILSDKDTCLPKKSRPLSDNRRYECVSHRSLAERFGKENVRLLQVGNSGESHYGFTVSLASSPIIGGVSKLK